jgi:hypothetical protein
MTEAVDTLTRDSLVVLHVHLPVIVASPDIAGHAGSLQSTHDSTRWVATLCKAVDLVQPDAQQAHETVRRMATKDAASGFRACRRQRCGHPSVPSHSMAFPRAITLTLTLAILWERSVWEPGQEEESQEIIHP